MTNLLYIFAWTVLVSTIPAALDIVHGLTGMQQVPRFFLRAGGRNYARSLAWFLVICAMALLAWGHTNVGWARIVLDLAVCVPAAILFARLVQATWRLYGGGLLTAGLTIYLWSVVL